MKFENTNLWRNSLGSVSLENAEQLERLRSVYKVFWDNACQLAAQISRELHPLTLHDQAHFIALWDRADQIAGPEFRLTPAEAFVFGGAILLHDAANTTAAFKGGLEEIRNTPEWKDIVSDMSEKDDTSPPIALSSEQSVQALLLTLRTLHGRQAERLGDLSFSNDRTGDSVHLINDDQLRTHLGPIIGLIAASHHWDIHELEKRLKPKVMGAIAGFSRDWTIRPILLACLLRCADAIQIDQSRAPDFLYAILRLRGISEIHWRAQNRIAAPAPDPDDHKSLVFSSTKPYLEQDADAWWIAHDAIQVAHSELQASSILLNDLRFPTFAIDRIRNAESPERLAKVLEAKGWRPISAEVKINRVDRIVEMFGGTKLYGNEWSVPLRELIQNAADAIKLRRDAELPGSDFEGRITVRLERDHVNGAEGFWLRVEDDGLGMSEEGLTGPLIDFGSSYVSSDLARNERPGLSAKGRNRIGRFGVGFFSVFMLSQRVLVTSRPFDKGLDMSRTLSFHEGMTLRPILLDTPPTSISVNISTRVSIFLTPGILDDVLTLRSNTTNREDVWNLSLKQLVSFTCPMIDVDIYVQDKSDRRVKAHSRNWIKEDRTSWLRDITLADVRSEQNLDEAINLCSSLLRPINPADYSAGLLTIAFRKIEAGVTTIGGLKAGRRGTNLFQESFVGTLDYNPDGPQRSAGLIRDQALLSAWATEQAVLIAGVTEDPIERHRAALTVVDFGGDPLSVATMYINRSARHISEIAQSLLRGEELACPLVKERMHHGDDIGFFVIGNLRIGSNFHEVYLKHDEIYFTRTVIERIILAPHHRRFYQVPAENDLVEFGFLGSLKRALLEKRYELCSRSEEVEVARYVGKSSERDNLIEGQTMKQFCLLLNAKALDKEA